MKFKIIWNLKTLKFKKNIKFWNVIFLPHLQKFMSRIFHKEFFLHTNSVPRPSISLSKNSLRNHFIKTMTMNRTMQSSSHIFHIHLTWRKKISFQSWKRKFWKAIFLPFSISVLPLQFKFLSIFFAAPFCVSQY